MIKVIKFFFKSSWTIIILASIGSAVTAALNLLSFKLLSEIVTDSESNYVILILLISTMVTASAAITLVIGKKVTKHFENKVADYRRLLTERVLTSNYQKIEKKLDRLVPVLLFEINTLGNFGKTIATALVAIFQVIAVMGYLISVSWQLSTLVFIIFAIIAITNFVFLPRFKRLESYMSKTRFKLHFSLDRLEKGFKDLGISSRHASQYVKNSIDKPSLEVAKKNVNIFVLRTKVDSMINILVMVGIGIALIVSVHSLKLEQSVLIQYLALLLFIIPSAITILGFLKEVKNAENAFDQVQAFDVNLQQIADVAHSMVAFTSENERPLISIKNIHFKYENDSDFALGPVTFDVLSNEIVIINGGNGSGKSTLFKLITGLYLPDVGEVFFQDQLLTDENMQSYRDHFGCYFTDSPVFDDFTYLDAAFVKTEGKVLIDKLDLKGKIHFDDNLNISDINLSHGQRGRLNLLRLLLQDSQIYFFDEWAANQDVHFKEYFYNQIVPSLKRRGKTVILISHDDKYYNIADKIVTLKNGQIMNQSI